MQQLIVEIPQRSYPIVVVDGLLADAQALRAQLRSRILGNQVAVVTNDVVGPLYLEQVMVALDGLQVDVMHMRDGEAAKNLATYEQVMDFLLGARHNRSTCLIALGGGVVGDLCGFVAATFQRGVDLIQIPTTLLAQVDSSVGGKTGVNHQFGKNMIGAFYQPQCVLADTDVLATLPAREIRAGLAEVVKYGLINNPQFFSWLEERSEDILGLDDKCVAELIHICCEEKARIVSSDEKEAGTRALLNLGHTFGHAIETATGYGKLLHGETVAMGIVMAADLSKRLGWLDSNDATRIREVLEENFGLPVVPPSGITLERYFELMSSDKKVEQGKIRFILLKGIGQAVIEGDVERELIEITLGAGDELCA